MKKRDFFTFAAGAMLGAALVCTAAAAGILAEPSWSPIYVDGRQVDMAAYNIAGNNYVRLRDIGQAVDFNVYYQNGVQIESDAPYTGTAPAQSAGADLIAGDEVRQEMIRLVNQARRDSGVAELTVNEALMNAAQDCSFRRFTSHHSQTECETVLAHGYPCGFESNLCVLTDVDGSEIARRAVESWMASPRDCQAMMGAECDAIGVGITVHDGTCYCYMLAGNPSAQNPYGNQYDSHHSHRGHH